MFYEARNKWEREILTSSGDRKTPPSAPDFRGSAAQRIAVESFKNIANVVIGEVASPPADEADIAAVVALLQATASPIAIAEVAERLGWDSTRAANALAAGGAAHRLMFFTSDGWTKVGIAGGSRAAPPTRAAGNAS